MRRANPLAVAIATAFVGVVISLGCGRLGFDSSPGDTDAGVACSGEGTACSAGDLAGVCLNGTCCTGCISGGTCLAGGASEACGSGGETCASCSDRDFCERRQCVAGESRIGLGGRHSCAIVNGELFCWGDNQFGQLGLGDRERRLTPVKVGAESDWFAVSAGESHTCGLRGAGELYCWGENQAGGVMTGDFEPRAEPFRVGVASDWVEVDCGHNFSCARNASGELWCGGQNNEAQLGSGSRSPPSPGGISELLQVGGESDWIDIGAGRGHNCGLRGVGDLYCWGSNLSDQQGHAGGSDDVTQVPSTTVWRDVIGNTESTCAFSEAGQLFCWGDNNMGLFGLGDSNDLPTPTAVPGNFASWSSYIFHSCAITSLGTLSCSGRAIEGQLGIDDADAQLNPIEPDIGLDDWVEIKTGRFWTCARRRGGAIYCTGANDDGQLGVGDVLRRDGFEVIALPE